MNPQEAPGMPTQQIPLNFDQETGEERLARLKKDYRTTFGQESDLMKLNLKEIETALKDSDSIKAHRDAINDVWQKNREEDQRERSQPGYR